MLKIGVQSQNAVFDDDPFTGYQLLKRAGFDCCDFSLNAYLLNTSIYNNNLNSFFSQSDNDLFKFFSLHKKAAECAGIEINQMHMPYPIRISNASNKTNDYLLNQVVPKSLRICKFLGCHNIVVHGLKMKDVLGSEEKEWKETKDILDSLASFAKENNIVICLENLYESTGCHIVEGPGCNAYRESERIDRFNTEHGAEVLGFCYDTGHANLIGLDHFDFISTLGKRLKVLHIHDNDGIGDLHQIPFTFTRVRENTTSTDWNGFIAGLKKINFDGVLSFETAPVLKSFPNEMKEDVLTFIAKIGKYFGKKICNEI